MNWKTVAAFPDYEVSDQGEVRRVTAKTGTRVGKVMSPSFQQSGHSYIGLMRNGKQVRTMRCRLVAEAFIGPPPRGAKVHHRNLNVSDDRVENLEYVTTSEIRRAYLRASGHTPHDERCREPDPSPTRFRGSVNPRRPRWRPIAGFESTYHVSDTGVVRRMAPGPGTQIGRALVLRTSNSGYARVGLYDKPRARTVCVHRLVTMAFIGPCPQGAQVNHRDGNKLNNRADNLEYVTAAQNQQHRYKVLGHNNCPSGEARKEAKLTDKKVMMIRNAKGGRGLVARLAREHRVSSSLISMIRSGRVWKHLVR